MVWIASDAEEIPSTLCHQHEIQGTSNFGIRLSRFTSLLRRVGVQIQSMFLFRLFALGWASITAAAQYPFLTNVLNKLFSLK